MSGKRVIRLGDPITHGGTVVSATVGYVMFGKEVAGRGDTATCPIRGHGVVTIVEGDPSWTINGKNVALEGHKCSCGCSLISTLPNVGRSYEATGETGAGIGGSEAGTLAKAKEGGSYDEHFVLRDIATGNPVSGFAYGMATSFGEHHDDTYEDGATAKAYSESPIPVKLLYAMQKEIGLR